MSTISAESPLGQALNERVLPKLMELGWSSGEQDDTLSEYIILMLANGNNEEQIATELATDLLNTEPDDPAPANFAKWLFQQVNELQQAQGGAQAASSAAAGAAPAADASTTADTDMTEGADTSGAIPTGPKAMRNGAKGAARDKRMSGNPNKAMDRSADSVLHRVRGTQGTGRINSHSRDPPKGPRQTNIQRNLAAAGVGRGGPGMMQNMSMPGQMGQMAYPQQNGGQMVMDSNQMQQMLQMLERQAQMMAQMSNSMQPNQGGNFHNGRSFGDRSDKRNKFNNRSHHNQQSNKSTGGDTEMGEDGQPKEGGDAAARGENGHEKSAAETMCRFNKQCKNPDCIYAHSGPMTYTGIIVDTSSVCDHGAACTNNRCASRHPSPAKKQQYQATVPCKYGPYCQKPGCTFQHPPNGPCKNGADCTEEGCQYWHNPVMCKYPQCTNKACPYKHAPGQKRGYYRSNQVIFNGGEAEKHVSERQFVSGEGEEELITPGAAAAEGTSEGMDVIT
ncbi:uncharacterized protein PV09_05799 [Verruconis gallopava]|uniref:Nab2 type CCCH zinc finger 4 domain-containing protein n=1 Tax=Verruconis gallopava TaxID=253628 RepID=A0A0D1XL81_9PEZI|nr:uncharacterized protein PV09_05799 [Verruconis gallopava]KIW03156.1 hypothetical protein PV09_05799 [Verruconis gallopava]